MGPWTVVYILMGVAFGKIFWTAAELEESKPCMLWTCLSVGVFAVTWLWLGWTMSYLIVAQVGLGVLIAAVRTVMYLRQTSGK